jgi:tRNA (guanine37-N1)-methyltransferase
MILRPEPVAEALDAVAPEGSGAFRILLDPGGEPFRQSRAHDLAEREHLVFVCPRYEGVDDRVRSMVDLELSVGDFVLSGGEIAALAVIDAVLRLLPGAIEDASTEDESFSAGLLEYPQWTRPPDFRGQSVPEILTSGNHGAVDAWRHEQAFERTRRVRPDLLTEDELGDD